MTNRIMELADKYEGMSRLLPDEVAEARAALLAEVERVSKDAERWQQLAAYLISPSTEFDDAIVASNTVSEMADVVDTMKEPS